MNYIFTFVTETSIPEGGYIDITFPIEFPPNLGFKTKNPSCSSRCLIDVTGRKVTFTIDRLILFGLSMEVWIDGV